MELIEKNGLKNSEVGLIPSDWKCEIIDDLASITTGGSDTQDRVDDGLYPFFVRSDKVERINKYSFDGEAVLTSGDGVGVGKIFHYVNGKFDFHQRVYNIHNYRDDIDGKYLFFQFSTNFYDRVMSMTAKSSVDSVRREMIAEMFIPLPPTLEEQKAIATALSDVDDLISNLDKLIAKKKDIKKGAMQQLLTPPHKGGKRLPGFSGNWEEMKLGELCEIAKGQLITSSTLVPGDIPVIAGGKKPAYYHNEPNRTGKTITISASGASAGYVSFHDYPIFASDCSTIVENQDYSIEFIYSLLVELQSLIYFKQTGGAQPHIHPSDLNPIEVNIPQKDEQMAIASVLHDMQREIDSLDTKRQKLIEVKKGMMQELLTGKTRLV